jgi:hypothetical protein
VLRHVTLSAAADAVRPVEEEVAIAGGGFRILVDRDDDGLDMRVAPPFPRCLVPDFRQRLDPGRMLALSLNHRSGSAISGPGRRASAFAISPGRASA